MLEFFKKSLLNKLIFAFLSVGLLPFVIFLVYTLMLSEAKIVNKLVFDQHHNAQVLSQLIKTHLDGLEKEVNFLARLDIMDDILAEDIDKRVSRLLEQKKDDYSLDLEFLVVNDKSLIIAASDKERLFTSCGLVSELKTKKGSFLKNRKLYFYVEIMASFDKQKHLGFLLLEYNLDNLQMYLNAPRQEYAYLWSKDKALFIGKEPSFHIEVKGNSGSVSLDNDLVVYQKMQGVLKDWFIFYVAKKEIALAFFYDFIRFMLYLSPFIIVLTVFIAWKLSKTIVRPIEELTEITDEIVHSKDYSRYLQMASSDEVGRLAYSFNTLLTTMDKTLFASDAKTSFIHNMSHELKTPLNAIIGFSQYLISYEELSDEQIDIVANIERSSLYLLEMIHGILDIAKIESGKMEVNLSECDCLVLARECFDMLSPLAEDKELHFELKYSAYKKQSIQTDVKIFKQVLLNLLSNAIKYTQKGSVILELSNENTLVVKVIDTGIGIKEEEMGKLFKEFSRLHNELSTAQKGTGLGLSLSQKLAELIGGKITLESQGENQGVEARLEIK